MNNEINNAPSESSSAFFVYIVRTKNNKLYIGQTDCLYRREFEHKYHAHGAKFLKGNRGDLELVYAEEYETRVLAMNREKQLKGWTRAKKEALIVGDLKLLKDL
ncbi:MAG: GIY-YIG nuclease family protein [Candidatus Berkelbacteria bacterium]